MPELPDLEVIREYLAAQVVGSTVRDVHVYRPIVVRNLLGGELKEHLTGKAFRGVERRGKLLLLGLDGNLTVAIHLMLVGRIRYGAPLDRNRKRDAVVLSLDNGNEIRYHDTRDMGKVYLVNDLDQVPGYTTLGPDATDPELTIEVFCDRLRRHRGEIKGVLVNQRFVAGIGNAYADEILWQAGIYPFRRRPDLDVGEIQRLYQAMRTVLADAIETLRERVGETIDVEVRDFLSIHGKVGRPCPRCGTAISEVRRDRRATHFCRACQPGLMVDRGKGKTLFQ